MMQLASGSADITDHWIATQLPWINIVWTVTSVLWNFIILWPEIPVLHEIFHEIYNFRMSFAITITTMRATVRSLRPR